MADLTVKLEALSAKTDPFPPKCMENSSGPGSTPEPHAAQCSMNIHAALLLTLNVAAVVIVFLLSATHRLWRDV